MAVNRPPRDDNPEWTKEDFARARPASEVIGTAAAEALVRKGGRPPKPVEERKQQVTMRFAPDLLEAMRASGPGWQVRAEDVLRREFIDAPAEHAVIREGLAAAHVKAGPSQSMANLAARAADNGSVTIRKVSDRMVTDLSIRGDGVDTIVEHFDEVRGRGIRFVRRSDDGSFIDSGTEGTSAVGRKTGRIIIGKPKASNRKKRA